jgi:nicotinic acid mononucleotide adenylyltransferase
MHAAAQVKHSAHLDNLLFKPNSNQTCRPPDALLRQLQRYAWLPMLCEAVMSLKDCCSTQQMAGSSDHAAAEAMQHADTAILALGR